MRHDVVDNLCRIYPAAMLAEVINGNRMSSQIGSCSLAPSSCIKLVILGVLTMLQAFPLTKTSIAVA